MKNELKGFDAMTGMPARISFVVILIWNWKPVEQIGEYVDGYVCYILHQVYAWLLRYQQTGMCVLLLYSSTCTCVWLKCNIHAALQVIVSPQLFYLFNVSSFSAVCEFSCTMVHFRQTLVLKGWWPRVGGRSFSAVYMPVGSQQVLPTYCLVLLHHIIQLDDLSLSFLHNVCCCI